MGFCAVRSSNDVAIRSFGDIRNAGWLTEASCDGSFTWHLVAPPLSSFAGPPVALTTVDSGEHGFLLATTDHRMSMFMLLLTQFDILSGPSLCAKLLPETASRQRV